YGASIPGPDFSPGGWAPTTRGVAYISADSSGAGGGFKGGKPGQKVLVVGAETEAEFAYARQVAAGGSDVAVVNPRTTVQSKAYVSQGGNFIEGRLEELPAQPVFNVIREDFPDPL